MRKTSDRVVRPKGGVRVWAGAVCRGAGAVLAGLLVGCAATDVASTQPDPVSRPSEHAPLAPHASSTAPTVRSRSWPRRTVTYRAANNWHGPLWFEDAPLERYGCSVGDPFQPVVSIGLAAVHAAAIPYSAVRRPPWQRVYPSDWSKQPPPDCIMLPPVDALTPMAVLVEAGVVLGLIALVP